MNSISMRNIKKTYPNGKTVMQKFNLDIKKGSFTVLVGPSGCGKTTAIRIIAGLEKATEGEIWIENRNVTEEEPGDRGVAMVFQNYALYPHMTVEKNISYGLKNYGYGKDEIKKILKNVLELVGLTEYANVKPGSLSGGQRQRVALARAISKSPKVFLMDEPLSNLDARLRIQMRSELIRMHHKLQSTFVYITHDQVEAMTMGDYIAVMKDGKIMQYGTPEEVYDNPANIFTAKFIGDPGMNILEQRDGASLGFRSKKVLFKKPQDFCGISISSMISTKERLGGEYHYTVLTQAGDELAIRTEHSMPGEGNLDLYVPHEFLYAFDKDGNRTELINVIKN